MKMWNPKHLGMCLTELRMRVRLKAATLNLPKMDWVAGGTETDENCPGEIIHAR